ncbi:MAG: TIGR00282 family metallophosphoesterase [Spirochaetales bacterium]|nr:TIGR00282 family metallophosphoesterase [Spirochaetales bacterium]
MANELRALILGDVVGSPGSRALFFGLKKIIKEERADLVIVNGENAADGFGMMPDDVERLFTAGADVITSGNHIWQKKDILPVLEAKEFLLRPANYPPGVPGHGHCIIEKNGIRTAVVNMLGRSRMGFNGQCPFQTMKKLVRELNGQADYIILDFHAEDPQEKEALAIHMDGQISLLFGTHTHVQTADERIFPHGTGYISDIGMVGPSGSVIGADPEQSIKRSLTQLPIKMEVIDNPAQICGIVVDFADGKAQSIRRFKQMASA